jgi:ankyrin repeat protein
METLETLIDNENWHDAIKFLKNQNSLDDIDFWYVFTLRTKYLTENEHEKLELVNNFIDTCRQIGYRPYNIPQAVSLGDFELVKAFITDGHDVDETEFRDVTGLIIAVLQQDLKMVEYLLSNGASNYSEDIDGNKPIDYAIKDSEIYKLLKLSGVLSKDETEEIMDDYYSAVDFANDLRSTQMDFMKGAENGDIELMKEALSRPKGLWVLNGSWPVNGKTALHLATENNRIEACDFLLKKGLDKYKPDHKGETAFDIAKRLNFKEILKIMEEIND